MRRIREGMVHRGRSNLCPNATQLMTRVGMVSAERLAFANKCSCKRIPMQLLGEFDGGMSEGF